MKQLFITILLLITSVGMLFGQFARGNGTESEPWQIETAEHLNNIRNYLRVTNNDKHFILMNDISLTEYLSESGAGYTAWNTLGWEPIGYYDSGTYQDIFFTGKFDDNKKKITGLKINRSEDGDIGLFGGLGSSAEIKNLGIEIQPESSVV